MEHLDYRKKLGIGFCDKEKNEYFLVRMRNHISILENNINQPELEDDIVFRYCNITGTDYAYIDSSFEGIIDDIYDEKDFLSFVVKYISLMNLLMEVKGNISVFVAVRAALCFWQVAVCRRKTPVLHARSTSFVLEKNTPIEYRMIY